MKYFYTALLATVLVASNQGVDAFGVGKVAHVTKHVGGKVAHVAKDQVVAHQDAIKDHVVDNVKDHAIDVIPYGHVIVPVAEDVIKKARDQSSRVSYHPTHDILLGAPKEHKKKDRRHFWKKKFNDMIHRDLDDIQEGIDQDIEDADATLDDRQAEIDAKAQEIQDQIQDHVDDIGDFVDDISDTIQEQTDSWIGTFSDKVDETIEKFRPEDEQERILKSDRQVRKAPHSAGEQKARQFGGPNKKGPHGMKGTIRKGEDQEGDEPRGPPKKGDRKGDDHEDHEPKGPQGKKGGEHQDHEPKGPMKKKGGDRKGGDHQDHEPKGPQRKKGGEHQDHEPKGPMKKKGGDRKGQKGQKQGPKGQHHEEMDHMKPDQGKHELQQPIISEETWSQLGETRDSWIDYSADQIKNANEWISDNGDEYLDSANMWVQTAGHASYEYINSWVSYLGDMMSSGETEEKQEESEQFFLQSWRDDLKNAAEQKIKEEAQKKIDEQMEKVNDHDTQVDAIAGYLENHLSDEHKDKIQHDQETLDGVITIEEFSGSDEVKSNVESVISKISHDHLDYKTVDEIAKKIAKDADSFDEDED